MKTLNSILLSPRSISIGLIAAILVLAGRFGPEQSSPVAIRGSDKVPADALAAERAALFDPGMHVRKPVLTAAEAAELAELWTVVGKGPSPKAAPATVRAEPTVAELAGLWDVTPKKQPAPARP